jgi:hypothetical protein
MADGYTGLHTRRAFTARGASLTSVSPSRVLAGLAADSASGPTPPANLIGGLRSFATGHGGATAVIEYAGRKGARIILAGGDGAGAEQYAESTEAARAACAQAGVNLDNEWERELTEQMQLGSELRGARGRRALTR